MLIIFMSDNTRLRKHAARLLCRVRSFRVLACLLNLIRAHDCMPLDRNFQISGISAAVALDTGLVFCRPVIGVR